MEYLIDSPIYKTSKAELFGYELAIISEETRLLDKKIEEEKRRRKEEALEFYKNDIRSMSHIYNS